MTCSHSLCFYIDFKGYFACLGRELGFEAGIFLNLTAKNCWYQDQRGINSGKYCKSWSSVRLSPKRAGEKWTWMARNFSL